MCLPQKKKTDLLKSLGIRRKLTHEAFFSLVPLSTGKYFLRFIVTGE